VVVGIVEGHGVGAVAQVPPVALGRDLGRSKLVSSGSTEANGPWGKRLAMPLWSVVTSPECAARTARQRKCPGRASEAQLKAIAPVVIRMAKNTTPAPA